MLDDNDTSAAKKNDEIVNYQNKKFNNQRVPVKRFDIPDQSFLPEDFIFQPIKNIAIKFADFFAPIKSQQDDDISSPFI